MQQFFVYNIASMKIVKLLAAAAFMFAVLASPSFADQEAPCCVKAKEAKGECAHKCCVDKRKDNKVCERCGGKTEPKKKPS
jgi:hypothetical protein